MKKITLLTTIIFIFLTTVSFAQEDEWSSKYLLNRLFKNGQKIGDRNSKGAEINLYGKNSYLDKNGEKVFELVKFDTLSKTIIPFLTGKIDGLQVDKSDSEDSPYKIKTVLFTWNIERANEEVIQTAEVLERTIIDYLGKQTITILYIKFNNSNENYFAWNEENYYENDEKKDISIPQFLKVKRICVSIEDSEEAKDLINPEEKINYALWTQNAFYRYAKSGLKDKIKFARQFDTIHFVYHSSHNQNL